MLAARNYPPSDDLSSFVRRHYVFSADLPPGHIIDDRILSETAFARIIVRGNWTSPIEGAWYASPGSALLFGGNIRPFPVIVEGPFTVAGFGIRPRAWRALFAAQAADLLDRAEPLRNYWGKIADDMAAEVMQAQDDAAMIAAMERAIRAQLDVIGRWSTDSQVASFETLARTDSTIRIDEAARRLKLSVGQMERRVRAGYGITPKMVLRRSRFLELASALRGMTTPAEQYLAVLRFFDQSHINREFRQFSGLTPRNFKAAHTPLFDAGLILRVEGLLME
jgi:methylphosphotriester-DNA--protein-cysteine methyltransferase